MKGADAHPLRRVLVFVAHNPQTSHRPAEAVRVAAGLSASRRLQVNLCLEGAAISLLDSSRISEWIDSEWVEKGLPLLAQTGGQILVKTDDAPLPSVASARLEVRLIDRRDLAELESSSHATLRF